MFFGGDGIWLVIDYIVHDLVRLLFFSGLWANSKREKNHMRFTTRAHTHYRLTSRPLCVGKAGGKLFSIARERAVGVAPSSKYVSWVCCVVLHHSYKAPSRLVGLTLGGLEASWVV